MCACWPIFIISYSLFCSTYNLWSIVYFFLYTPVLCLTTQIHSLYSNHDPPHLFGSGATATQDALCSRKISQCCTTHTCVLTWWRPKSKIKHSQPRSLPSLWLHIKLNKTIKRPYNIQQLLIPTSIDRATQNALRFRPKPEKKTPISHQICLCDLANKATLCATIMFRYMLRWWTNGPFDQHHILQTQTHAHTHIADEHRIWIMTGNRASSIWCAAADSSSNSVVISKTHKCHIDTAPPSSYMTHIHLTHPHTPVCEVVVVNTAIFDLITNRNTSGLCCFYFLSANSFRPPINSMINPSTV